MKACSLPTEILSGLCMLRKCVLAGFLPLVFTRFIMIIRPNCFSILSPTSAAIIVNENTTILFYKTWYYVELTCRILVIFN